MPTLQDDTEFLTDVLLGNQDAVRLVLGFAEVSQVWDDLVDEDGPVPPDVVNAAFHTALVRIPMNAFYRAHVEILSPVVNAVVLDWIASNALERGTEHERTIAWSIRDNLCSLVVTCAQLVGGYHHAVEVGPRIHSFGRDEPLRDYLEDKDVHRRKEGRAD